MTVTAAAAKMLSDDERVQLNEYLERAGLTTVKKGARGARASEGLSRYQALVNLSVPVRDTKTGAKTDKNRVAAPGETVWLDEEEAASLLSFGPGTGRQAPAVRRIEEAKEPLPTLLPRQLSGPVLRPVQPAPGDTGPRPDPQGSSRIIEQQPVTVPEGLEPQPGSETGAEDALDIAPRGAGTG